MANTELLAQPFDQLHQRQGAGGKTFDYVKSGDVIQRVLEATDNCYEWEVLRFDYRDAVSVEAVNKRTGETYTKIRPAYWMVHGRLTLPGLGSRDGLGTQVEENEDSAKGAETDAFKRAAVKFGVALGLYIDSDGEAQAAPIAAERPASAPRDNRNAGSRRQPTVPAGPLCPECNAPNGKHATKCSLAGVRV